MTQCVSVPIINDECVEQKQEQFIVSLSTTDEDCVEFGDPSESVVTIADDDGVCACVCVPVCGNNYSSLVHKRTKL